MHKLLKSVPNPSITGLYKLQHCYICKCTPFFFPSFFFLIQLQMLNPKSDLCWRSLVGRKPGPIWFCYKISLNLHQWRESPFQFFFFPQDVLWTKLCYLHFYYLPPPPLSVQYINSLWKEVESKTLKKTKNKCKSNFLLASDVHFR